MKKFINENGVRYDFELDCFDENGKVINEIVEKIIAENSLVEMTEEEYNTYLATKEAERLAEEGRLAKLPTQEELEDAKLTLKILEMKELGLI